MWPSSSNLSYLRFASITVPTGSYDCEEEVLFVASYRIPSSGSWWCPNLHSPPTSPTPTSVLGGPSENTEEKVVPNFIRVEKQVLEQPLLDPTP